MYTYAHTHTHKHAYTNTYTHNPHTDYRHPRHTHTHAHTHMSSHAQTCTHTNIYVRTRLNLNYTDNYDVAGIKFKSVMIMGRIPKICAILRLVSALLNPKTNIKANTYTRVRTYTNTNAWKYSNRPSKHTHASAYTGLYAPECTHINYPFTDEQTDTRTHARSTLTSIATLDPN